MRFNPFNVEVTNLAKQLDATINNIGVSNWTDRSVPGFPGICGAYSESLGIHVALGNSTSVYTSTDGVVWTQRALAVPAGAYNSVCYSEEAGIFAAVASNKIVTSDDGITWTEQTNIVGDTSWYKVIYASGLNLFVAVGGDGGAGTYETIMTSPDGITWTNRTAVSVKPYYLVDVAYRESDNLLVAVTDAIVDDTAVLTSTDGINWTLREITGTPNAGWFSIAYNSNINLFCIATYNPGINQIATSTDGITWTIQTGADFPAGINHSFYSPTYKKFILVDITGSYPLYVSDDGINFTNKFYVSGIYPNSLFDNGSYVIGVQSNSISHSLLR